ncbi:phenoloxidase-activating factor 1-like [Trichoplusia ni]|uniref:Phenoloxidase-activating factor 1-like n=1 Tax=Trichoplusia ni TaxID=7111 RepID=A0A7E5VI47_TRINI|nr:phenoloxidase-activating factor 1-like [Trichoplusia ni]
MCYVCCKELKGWCKSFTRIEGFLSVLQAILLVVFIFFLVFLILHFVGCLKIPEEKKETTTDIKLNTSDDEVYEILATTTLSPDVECTWDPSKPTTVRVRYYLNDINTTERHDSDELKVTKSQALDTELVESFLEYDDFEFSEHSDGDFADETFTNQVVALVKLKPPADVTFGCILTKVTKFWTLTAASCIESIEEVDSLDSFVMIEQYGSARQSRARGVADVRLHPQAAGAARSHDLAALRADRALRAPAPLPALPSPLDYFSVAVGERFVLLGYGGYRTVDKGPAGRRLRQVSVFAVSAAQCAGWAPRHLAGGARVAGALCAGARRARSEPCNYCAGAPLLRGGTLYGVMSDNAACAVACEPQLYVNLAMLRDWIDAVIQ